MTNTDLVSIVVNTFNRGDLLKSALQGLSKLTYPKFEIVVVNGPSRDRTDEILSAWKGLIKVGSCPSANLSLSRNIGISLAAGELIAFIDDDAVPHPRWISRLIPAYGDARVGGVGGYTVGQSGAEFQARKTVCDRFGDAHSVSDYFDTRCLNVPRSWAYPALLGTNCSFRRQALEEIGGFDETFSYFLDETDVCLRLVDAGWHVVHEPTALVWHAFSASIRRNAAATPKSILEVVRSQSYFIHRHCLRPLSVDRVADADARLIRLAEQWRWANRNALETGEISELQRARLDCEIEQGIADGVRAAGVKGDELSGDLASHLAAKQFPKPFPRRMRSRLGICLVSRAYASEAATENGRWTAAFADALVELGHSVHVLTETRSAVQIRFHDGVWIHEVACAVEDSSWLVHAYDLPSDVAAWAETVRRGIAGIKSFGLDLVSFPIWDLEGIGCLGDPDLSTVISLGNSYAMSQSLREEWRYRPLHRQDFVRRMAEAERAALDRVPLVLATDRNVFCQAEHRYGLNLRNRVAFTVAGVPVRPVPPNEMPNARIGLPLSVLFVGRFETASGFDVAVRAVTEALHRGARLTATFVAGVFGAELAHFPGDLDIATVRQISSIKLRGEVTNLEMDMAYTESDVVLIPSPREAFSWPIAEAFSKARPVIVTAGEDTAELVENGNTGFVVEPSEDPAIAIAALLCELATDREQLSTMGANAWRVAEARYSAKHMAKGVEPAFLDVVASRRRQR